MPLFEYICQTCKKTCELLVTGSQLPVCPSCGSKKLQKQLSTFSALGVPDMERPSCVAGGGCPSAGGCSAAAGGSAHACPYRF